MQGQSESHTQTKFIETQTLSQSFSTLVKSLPVPYSHGSFPQNVLKLRDLYIERPRGLQRYLRGILEYADDRCMNCFRFVENYC